VNPSLLLPVALVAFAGAAAAMQPAFNSQLAGHLGSPLRAALVNFTAGASIMLAVTAALALRTGLPSAEQLAKVPLHLWIAGGALGAIFVSTATWAAPKLGVGAFFAVLIAAQLIAAMAMDQVGALGLEVRPITLTKLAGAALLFLGAMLMVRG